MEENMLHPANAGLEKKRPQDKMKTILKPETRTMNTDY
jgi:hypothetical protein